jgi:nucleotide-binding universal stress UspA family protein
MHGGRATPTIVVGVDGSENARRALEWAVEEAARRGTPVRMIHAVTVGARQRRSPETAMLEMYHAGRAVFDDARAHLSDVPHGVRLGTALVAGPPSRVLTDHARRAQMCVVGRSGGRLSVLGSTALHLAVHSDVPVVVVPTDWGQARAADAPVVVGVDIEADCHDRAIEFAFDTARARSAPILAVYAASPYVWRPTEPGALPAGHPARRSGREAEEVLWHVLTPWRDKYPSTPTKVVVEASDPVPALSRYARGAALVVLGRPHPPRRSVPGTVTRALLHRASCPVAVVPDPSPLASALAAS